MRSIKQRYNSNRYLAIFAVVFAIIGGLYVFKSFASSTTSYPLYLTASPSSVSAGGSFKLSWDITGYSNESGMACTLTDTLGAYTFTGPVSGGRYRSPGSVTVSNYRQTDTFVMHCENACSGGTCQAVADNRLTVAVIQPKPIISMSANPSSVSYKGYSTIAWNSSNASSCSASGAWSGSKGTSGSYFTGTLYNSSTYKLTCSGSGGSVSKSVSVSVGPAPSPAPTPTPTNTITTVPPKKSSNSGVINVDFISGLSVYGITDTSAHVTWTTTSSVLGHLSYGISYDNQDKSIDEHTPTTHHDILIDNLDPDTPYFFLVESSNGKKTYKEDGSFTTNPASGAGSSSSKQAGAGTKVSHSNGGVILIMFILLVLSLFGVGVWLLKRRRQAEEDLYGHSEAEEFFTDLSQTETYGNQQQASPQLPLQPDEQYQPHELLPKKQTNLSLNGKDSANISSNDPQDMFAEGRERLQREGLSTSEQSQFEQTARPAAVTRPVVPELNTSAETDNKTQQNQEQPPEQPKENAPQNKAEIAEPQNNTFELRIDHGS